MLVKRADELSAADIGSKVRSIRYPNKNKTAKPTVALWNGGKSVTREYDYVIESIYAHANGTILLNQNGWAVYLHPDTLVYFLDTETI